MGQFNCETALLGFAEYGTCFRSVSCYDRLDKVFWPAAVSVHVACGVTTDSHMLVVQALEGTHESDDEGTGKRSLRPKTYHEEQSAVKDAFLQARVCTAPSTCACHAHTHVIMSWLPNTSSGWCCSSLSQNLFVTHQLCTLSTGCRRGRRRSRRGQVW